jgi:RND superfamily putative drug exporter
MGPGWATPFQVALSAREGAITTPARLRSIARWETTVRQLPGVAAVLGPADLGSLDAHAAPSRAELARDTVELERGPGQLSQLSDGLHRASDGIGALTGGLQTAVTGARQLAGGDAHATSSATLLQAGLNSARTGTAALNSGLGEAHGAALTIAHGTGALSAGATKLAHALAYANRRVVGELALGASFPSQLRSAASDISQLAPPVSQAEHDLIGERTALQRMTSGKLDPRYGEAYRLTLRALAALTQTSPAAAATVSPSDNGIPSLLSDASQGLSSAADYASTTLGNVRVLTDGLARLSDGASRLAAGADRLGTGGNELAAALGTGAGGAQRLAGGLRRLYDGAAAFHTGLHHLAYEQSRLAAALAASRGPIAALQSHLAAGGRKVLADLGALPGAGITKLLDFLNRNSPGFLQSGYTVLAAADGARAGERAAAGLLVSLDHGGRGGNILIVPTEPTTNPATQTLDNRLTKALPHLAAATNSQVGLGGVAALLEDYGKVTRQRFPVLVAALSLVSGLALIVVFRSLLLPLLAVLLNLVSVGGAFGILVLLYEGRGPLADTGYLDAVSTAGVFTILFGLSLDYQVFLVLRMREAWLRHGDPSLAIQYGLKRTAKVITGAAAIMIGVFASFSLVAREALLQQFGIGLLIAVALDATLVRLVLLPAGMSLLGRWCWWLPSPLRWLPELGVETPSQPGRG